MSEIRRKKKAVCRKLPNKEVYFCGKSRVTKATYLKNKNKPDKLDKPDKPSGGGGSGDKSSTIKSKIYPFVPRGNQVKATREELTDEEVSSMKYVRNWINYNLLLNNYFQK